MNSEIQLLKLEREIANLKTNIAEKDAEIAKGNAEIAKGNLRENSLHYELASVNKELLVASRHLFARQVLHNFEDKLVEEWCKEKLQRNMPPMSRFYMWNEFLSLYKRQKVQELKGCFIANKLTCGQVPRLVCDLTEKLNHGIHNCFIPEMTTILLDKEILTEDEVNLMISICDAYPLGPNSFKVVLGPVKIATSKKYTRKRKLE